MNNKSIFINKKYIKIDENSLLKNNDIISTCSEFTTNTLNNLLNIDNKFNLKNINNSKNQFSDFDIKSALKEFVDFQIISPSLIDEKFKDKLIDLKSGLKVKSKFTIGKENLMNWKFEEKLKESKKIKIFLYFLSIILNIVGLESIIQMTIRSKDPIGNIEEMMKIPYFLFNENQRKIFLKKILLICDIYGQHCNTLRIYLEDKLNNFY